jgi:hypothetical protein
MSDHTPDHDHDLDWATQFMFSYQHQLKRELRRNDPTRYKDHFGSPVPISLIKTMDRLAHLRWKNDLQTGKQESPDGFDLTTPESLLTYLMFNMHEAGCPCWLHFAIRECHRLGEFDAVCQGTP